LRTTARITGNFVAQGGGNDIYCVIVDESDYINYRNKNQYRVYYESGKVTVGEVDRNLPSGTYYLIFDNSHALFTNKVVTASFEIE